jgi:hypothetical protein
VPSRPTFLIAPLSCLSLTLVGHHLVRINGVCRQVNARVVGCFDNYKAKFNGHKRQEKMTWVEPTMNVLVIYGLMYMYLAGLNASKALRDTYLVGCNRCGEQGKKIRPTIEPNKLLSAPSIRHPSVPSTGFLHLFPPSQTTIAMIAMANVCPRVHGSSSALAASPRSELALLSS